MSSPKIDYPLGMLHHYIKIQADEPSRVINLNYGYFRYLLQFEKISTYLDKTGKRMVSKEEIERLINETRTYGRRKGKLIWID